MQSQTAYPLLLVWAYVPWSTAPSNQVTLIKHKGFPLGLMVSLLLLAAAPSSYLWLPPGCLDAGLCSQLVAVQLASAQLPLAPCYRPLGLKDAWLKVRIL